MDKYQDSRKEASSEDLAEKRTTTWRGRRLIVKISTPTTETGPIWVAFTEEAQARFDWWVVCPECGCLQLMKFDNIRWPAEVEGPEQVSEENVWYQCEHCDVHWDNHDRGLAVRQGQWIERVSGLELFTHLKTHRISKLGFHIPSWISYFVSMSEIAAAFLKWKKSDRLKDLKNFMNQYKAEPWSEAYAARDEDAILALCDDRPRGIVPGAVDGKPRVAALVAGIDTQASYFRYVIRAFGYGLEEESWLIQHGTAPTFKALDELLWNSVYLDPEGKSHKVRAAVIDAMGAPGRTKAVYAWCAKRRRAMPYQGKQNVEGYVRYTPLTFFPDAKGAKIKIPGGLLLRRVDTTFFKSDLAEKLSVVPGDPGSFWLHADTKPKRGSSDKGGILADYAKEMCAEVFNPETLIWENPKQRPNHYWDCEVMSLVAAWELGLRNKRPPGFKPVKPKPQPAIKKPSAKGASAAVAFHVRDEKDEERKRRHKQNPNEPIREKGDKRLIIQDEEFVSGLACTKREGNPRPNHQAATGEDRPTPGRTAGISTALATLERYTQQLGTALVALERLVERQIEKARERQRQRQRGRGQKLGR